MRKNEFKNVSYDVETTGDLQMSVAIAQVHHTNEQGRHRMPDEVSFFISGYDYDPATDNYIEIPVTISKDEAKELAAVLMELAK